MSLAPPESAGPLRRERLRTARLYFVCDARPAGEDPEALLRAALGGGVDIVQLREKELDRAEIERAAATFRRVCDTYSALFIVNDDPELARACDADGVHVGQDDASVEEARELLGAGRDRRPLDPLPGADRRRRRAPGRLHQRRPDLGDADQGGPPRGRPRADLPRRRARAPPLLRDRRHRPANAGAGRGGRSATPLRGAGDPRRRRTEPPRPPALRRARRERRPVAERAAQAQAAQGARADGRAATPRPRSATRQRARRWRRWPRASGRRW